MAGGASRRSAVSAHAAASFCEWCARCLELPRAGSWSPTSMRARASQEADARSFVRPLRMCPELLRLAQRRLRSYLFSFLYLYRDGLGSDLRYADRGNRDRPGGRARCARELLERLWPGPAHLLELTAMHLALPAERHQALMGETPTVQRLRPFAYPTELPYRLAALDRLAVDVPEDDGCHLVRRHAYHRLFQEPEAVRDPALIQRYRPCPQRPSASRSSSWCSLSTVVARSAAAYAAGRSTAASMFVHVQHRTTYPLSTSSCSSSSTSLSTLAVQPCASASSPLLPKTNARCKH